MTYNKSKCMTCNKTKCMTYNKTKCMTYNKTKCMTYNKSKCMTYNKSKCMTYNKSKCMTYNKSKCMTYNKSKCMTYNKTKCMTYNKTKCMTYNKSARIIRMNFHVNGITLENVRSYKYLGFLLTPSGEIRCGLQDLRNRALKAFMKLKNLFGTAFDNDVLTTLNLIEAVIKPILSFTSELWGCMKLPKSNPIENLHMMMCKQILGVQKHTTNIRVLLELGRVPTQLFAVKLAIKNWERIKQKKKRRICY